MASDPDRSKDSNTSSQKPDVFIKFRQFADAQIGSLLQGIIGIPSAFSKNPAANARWADIDDDLRRRDELQARQRQLRDSEAQSPYQQSPHQGEEPPMKNWSEPVESSNTPRQMDDREARDLPLFSPTSKHLFKHIDQLGDETKDWDWRTLIGARFVPDCHPWPIRPGQVSSDVMTTTQYCMYNELNGQPFFRSNYSLLPYVLFSPYSPLKLQLNQDRQSSNGRFQTESFPYLEAFEDLIATSGGSPRSGPVGYGPARSLTIYPLRAVGWIGHMHNIGLLQQKEAGTSHSMINWPHPYQLAEPMPGNAFPVTELEMYEHFLTSPDRRSEESLTTLIEKAGKLFEKHFKALDTPEGQQVLLDFLQSKLAKELFGRQENSDGGPEVWISDNLKEVAEEIYRRPIPAQEAAPPAVATSKAAQDKDKVVSTSTTSERHVDEDGSVETTVSVWKRFADGRESTTTTTHCENSNGVVESEETKQETTPEKETNEKKKGWFWN